MTILGVRTTGPCRAGVSGSHRARDSIAGIALLMRIHTAGFEGLIFVLGPLLAGWRGSAAQFTTLWSLAVLVDGFIFALNDVIDLPHDRQNPARSRSPLVDGRVSVRTALALAVSLPLAATAIVMASDWPIEAEVSFVSMLVLGAIVDLYQKVTDHPMIMDLLYATAMALPLPVCTRALFPRIPMIVWCATLAAFLLALQLNSVAGNLKDLQSDQRTGFRTVAVSLGASISSGGTLVAGARYRRYCWILQAMTSVALAVTLADALEGRPLLEIVVVTVLAFALASAGIRDLHRLLNGSRQPSPRGREVYFAAGLAILLVIASIHSYLRPFLVAIALLVTWEYAFVLYRRWYKKSLRQGNVP